MNKKSTYEKEIPERSLYVAEQWFNNEGKFESEKEFTQNLLPKLHDLIKKIYNEDIKHIEQEKVFDFYDIGYFKVRVDLFVTCESGKQFVIECKNPTHNKSELLNAIGQMIGYQMLFWRNKNVKLILATSIFKVYLAGMIMNHNLKCDVLLNNKKGCSFLLANELNNIK